MPQLDIEEAPSEEEISHLPNSDAAENVASFLTEFEQQKTSSPVSQDVENFTTLFEDFGRERTMLTLPCHKMKKILLPCLLSLNGKKPCLVCMTMKQKMLLRKTTSRHECKISFNMKMSTFHPNISCLSLH